GGSGADTAAGGAGDDTFIVDSVDDVVLETAAGGVDTVLSNAVDFTLTGGAEGFIEVVEARTAGARLDGNAHDNTLLGGSLSNGLAGRDGNDVLDGGSGRDVMTGGGGDDTFVVDTATDRVRDGSAQGVDLVLASSDFTLPDGSAFAIVENLCLLDDSGALDGRGNSQDNTIEGNTGDNLLEGLSGADSLRAFRGDDRLDGGSGADIMRGDQGQDTLQLGIDDIAFGGAGNDSFVISDAAMNSGSQVIRDFDGIFLNSGADKDLLVFATGLETGVFSYIGGNAFSGGGNSEARFAGGNRVRIDQDGDGDSDILIRMNGLSQSGQITAGDFLWL
ncbi:MAG: calcium-binding protein, partial [Kiloniellales bacterium]